ncbi:hypothetical protein GCM10028824_36570 [Hymenobacter segetis]|uniref:HNH endonuclease n=1 Tax=Hymenobacter segetis TaxID=2025509 RepID=A0ABU9LV86_9BACT
MRTNTPKLPTTLTQALTAAEDTLTAAYHLKLADLLSSTATDAERVQLLAEFGGIAAAGSELDSIIAPLGGLRDLCRKKKPTASTYELVRYLLDTEAAPLSAITTDVLNHLSYLAAVVAEDRAAYQYKPDEAFPKRNRDLHPRKLTVGETNQAIADARERATAAKTLLAGLPAILTRVRELAEAGNDLTPAAAWLK